MKSLPNTIADPLHILPWWLSWFLVILLCIILYMVYKRYIKPWLEKIKTEKNKEETTEKIEKGKKIDETINSIQKYYLKNKKYRNGIFEVSAAVKTHLENKFGLPIEEMTGKEISILFQSKETGEFFTDIESIVFNSEGPEKDDLINMCTRAKEISVKNIKLK